MKNRIFLILIFLVIAVSGFAQSRSLLNSQWEFVLGDSKEVVSLPHTANVEPFLVNNQWQGVCTYSKSIFAPDDWNGKNVFVEFGGAMSVAKVSVNGQLVTTHYGGYLPFSVDITSFLKYGQENLLFVELDNRDNSDIPPGKPLKNLDFNWYGGLYRNVWLVVKDSVYITNPVAADKVAGGGIFLTAANLLRDNAKLTAKVNLKNTTSAAYTYELSGKIISPDGETFSTSSKIVKIGSLTDSDSYLEFELVEPLLWSPEFPNLYRLDISLLSGEELIDSYSQKIGFREISVSAGDLRINGKSKYLMGTNRHQDYPYIGYALSDSAQRREAKLIKEGGFDMVRFAHYPMATSFLDGCNEYGLVVMNPIPGWQYYKAGKFHRRTLQNAREMIRRDRNHPSVFFWELSLNESYMPARLIRDLTRIGKKELPGRDSIICGWVDNPAYDLFIPARQHGEAPSYWDSWKKGKKPIFTAEYGDWEYFARKDANFDQISIRDAVPDAKSSRHPRGAGEELLLQQAKNFQESHNQNQRSKSMIGDANWVFADYNRGYANDLCESGVVNLFRLPKFSYYFYQSQRDPRIVNPNYSSGPMVFIASYWQADSSLDLRIFSNCDQIELFLNGKTLGKKSPTIDAISDNLKHPPFVFNLDSFEAGELLALGYVDGSVVASHSVRTPGAASKIDIEVADIGIPLVADGSDAVFVHARILDEDGTVVVGADVQVQFTVVGGAQIVGPTLVVAEAGVATVLVQSNGRAEDIVITAESKGLQLGEIIIKPELK
ncbi:MAG: DUF4982 domain-containing protein [Spirochaetales bacterium]|nr:DUF4982 domain-containing protein [Spirochaetales bacterium]